MAWTVDTTNREFFLHKKANLFEMSHEVVLFPSSKTIDFFFAIFFKLLLQTDNEFEGDGLRFRYKACRKLV